MPALVTTAVFTFIYTYNDFFSQLIYLTDVDKMTVPVALRPFLDPSGGTSSFGGLFAMVHRLDRPGARLLPRLASACWCAALPRPASSNQSGDFRMASVTLDKLTKTYAGGTHQGRRRADARHRRRRVPGAGRPVGLRQVDGAPHDRRSGGDQRRRPCGSATSSSTTAHPKDRDIAMVFQNYALYPHMTVFDNIAFPLQIAKLPKAEITQARARGGAHSRARRHT